MNIWVGREPEKGFVDEGGGLERVPGAFLRHLRQGDLAELGIELIEERGGGAAPGFGVVGSILRLFLPRHGWIVA